MFVRWDRLGPDEWDDLVEVLIYRIYTDGEHTVVIYNGRGGDGGRDIVVIDRNGYVRIFQLKFLPGGFPGSDRGRRRSIEESFKTAMAHDPDEWILVVPNNLTSGEMTYLQKLARFKTTGKATAITHLAETGLTNELAKFPDLRTAFDRQELERLMELYNIERRALPGTPAEIDDRIAGAQEAIDAADQDWTWKISTIPGQEGRVLVPKHAGAQAVAQ